VIVRDVIGDVLSNVLSVPVSATLEEGFGPQRCANWDSLRHLRIVMALEARFSCVFAANEIPRLVSIPAIERLLLEKRR
jgi:acyl carrier protein